MQLDDEKTHAYAALVELLEGNDCKVRLILGAFHRSVGKALQRMECAATEGEWSLVRKLAHRMAIGCRQIGEERMADMLVVEAEAAIEHARYDAAADSGAFCRSFGNARRELIEVLDRAAAYASAIDLKSVA